MNVSCHEITGSFFFSIFFFFFQFVLAVRKQASECVWSSGWEVMERMAFHAFLSYCKRSRASFEWRKRWKGEGSLKKPLFQFFNVEETTFLLFGFHLEEKSGSLLDYLFFLHRIIKKRDIKPFWKVNNHTRLKNRVVVNIFVFFTGQNTMTILLHPYFSSFSFFHFFTYTADSPLVLSYSWALGFSLFLHIPQLLFSLPNWSQDLGFVWTLDKYKTIFLQI